MTRTTKPPKANKKKPALKPQGPFSLPRLIAQQLKVCADAHAAGKLRPAGTVTYLWINVANRSKARSAAAAKKAPALDWQEWLNVVDEAASLGMQYLVICVGDSLRKCPDVWRICRWAQRTHRIEVGIHTTAETLDPTEVKAITQLNPAKTWLFVRKKCVRALSFLADEFGVQVIAAEVDHEEHSPPCDMPESMVFVAPEGYLYTCGLVSDNDAFKLGHVGEQPLERLLSDPKRPHTIPKDVPHHEHGCDACPPLMAKRMKKGRS